MNKILKIFVCSLLFYSSIASVLWSADKAVEPKKEAAKAAEGQKSGDVKSPVAFFPEPAYHFESAVDGSELVHDFVIMNKGTDTLQVQKVRTG